MFNFVYKINIERKVTHNRLVASTKHLPLNVNSVARWAPGTPSNVQLEGGGGTFVELDRSPTGTFPDSA